jgi:DNA-binding response OmpR family regulator
MAESQYKFAEFQLDCNSFGLRRQGRAQKSVFSLERIPMELLPLLLERRGSVVARQEVVDCLSGKDVFLDSEHGINTAVSQPRTLVIVRLRVMGCYAEHPSKTLLTPPTPHSTAFID